MRTTLRAALLGMLAGCGPQSGEGTGTGASSGGSTGSTTEDPTGAPTGGSTGSTGEDPTGAGQCELAIGPLELPEDSPQGCLGLTDEASCLAEESGCTANYGSPARCDAGWCLTDPGRVFLGCRPFEICKDATLMVCRMTDEGVEAFWSERCIPPGFGRCEPGLPVDMTSPPRPCSP